MTIDFLLASVFWQIDVSIRVGENLEQLQWQWVVPQPQQIAVTKETVMGLVLNLSPELQRRLDKAASERGLPNDAFAIELLETELLRNNRREELQTLLQSWIDESGTDDQPETGNGFIRQLDEDRLSDRKLYPAELEGITW